MNLDDFSTVVEDRRYINPQVGLDESNAFIENLRNTQQANTQEIAQDTYNLGTAVPSNLGGLGGAGSYFTSRYQTPQTNDAISTLRSAAQAQALNEALNNRLAQAKEKYSQAYRNYQRKARRAALGSGTTATPMDGNKKDYFKVPGSDNGSKVNPNTNTGIGYLNVDNDSGVMYYRGVKGPKIIDYTLRNLTNDEFLQSYTGAITNPTNGTITTGRNGVSYLYVKNSQYPSGRWFAITGSR